MISLISQKSVAVVVEQRVLPVPMEYKEQQGYQDLTDYRAQLALMAFREKLELLGLPE